MSISLYYSMTWDPRGMSIFCQSLSDSLWTFTTDEICQILIGSYPSVWNKKKCWINSILKVCRHILFSAWHTIKIQTFLVYFWFGMKIFLFPFLEKTSFIHYSAFQKCLKAFWDKFPLWPILLIFEIMFALFKRLIATCLRIFTPNIDLIGRLFDTFGKPSSLCLSFYYWSFESVFICHNNKNYPIRFLTRSVNIFGFPTHLLSFIHCHTK